MLYVSGKMVNMMCHGNMVPVHDDSHYLTTLVIQGPDTSVKLMAGRITASVSITKFLQSECFGK